MASRRLSAGNTTNRHDTSRGINRSAGWLVDEVAAAVVFFIGIVSGNALGPARFYMPPAVIVGASRCRVGTKHSEISGVVTSTANRTSRRVPGCDDADREHVVVQVGLYDPTQPHARIRSAAALPPAHIRTRPKYMASNRREAA